MRDPSGRATGIMDRTTAVFPAPHDKLPSQTSLDAAVARTTWTRAEATFGRG